LRPGGLRTDIANALSKLRSFDPKPSSIVLVSDGANNFGDDPVHSASLLRIPIHTMVASSVEQTPDIEIARISEIPACYAGTNVTFWLEVVGRCERDVSTELRIIDSTGIVFSSEVVVPGKGATARIPVSIGCGDVGLHRYKAELIPFEGERVASNNMLEFALKVIRGKIQVFLVASKPSWDFAFALRALRESPAFDASTFFVDPEMAKLSTYRGGGIEEKMLASDVVIFFGGSVDAIRSEIISDYLSRGRGLILFEGIEGIGVRFSPFTRSGRSLEVKQFRPYPTPAGNEHQVTRIGEDGGFVWEKLPPVGIPASITGCQEGSLVLLEGRGEKESLPLLVVSRLDQGRVVAFSGVDLWRWDLSPSGFDLKVKVFTQIILNLVNWLSEQSELSEISVSTSKYVYLLGEPIGVVAKVVDANLKPLSGLKVSARITNQSLSEQSHSIDLIDLSNGSYIARLDLLDPGRYSVNIRTEYEGRTLAASAEFDVDSRGLEDLNFDGDRALLERISLSTGGRTYNSDESDDLIRNLELGSPVRDITRVLKFDLGIASFFVAVGIFGLEWFLRRRKLLI
ncbi:MAG: hypothetical protein ACUVQ7_09780, partial [bacterium]